VKGKEGSGGGERLTRKIGSFEGRQLAKLLLSPLEVKGEDTLKEKVGK